MSEDFQVIKKNNLKMHQLKKKLIKDDIVSKHCGALRLIFNCFLHINMISNRMSWQDCWMLALYLKWTAQVHVLLHVMNESVSLTESFVVVLYKSGDVAVPVILSLTGLMFSHVVQLLWQQLHLFLILGFNFYINWDTKWWLLYSWILLKVQIIYLWAASPSCSLFQSFLYYVSVKIKNQTMMKH